MACGTGRGEKGRKKEKNLSNTGRRYRFGKENSFVASKACPVAPAGERREGRRKNTCQILGGGRGLEKKIPTTENSFVAFKACPAGDCENSQLGGVKVQC